MADYMLDTNICSFIIRQKPDNIRHRLNEAVQNGSVIAISMVVYAELLMGAVSPKAPKGMRDTVEAFVSGLQIMPLTSAATVAASKIHAELLRIGKPIGFADRLIAGHAISEGCICVTNNTREFARVPGLRLEDWSLLH